MAGGLDGEEVTAVPDGRNLDRELRDIRGELNDLRDDLNRSTAGRSRLALIVTLLGVVLLLSWITTIFVIVQNGRIKEQNKMGNELGVEVIQQACYGYYQRTGHISPLCEKNPFVTPDGLSRK